jgi:WD40 repeat protein
VVQSRQYRSFDPVEEGMFNDCRIQLKNSLSDSYVLSHDRVDQHGTEVHAVHWLRSGAVVSGSLDGSMKIWCVQ